MEMLVALLAAWVALMAGAALSEHRLLFALWREPALRHPVLIIESDDWGPGPARQAEWLRRLRELLGRFKDARGRHPVMTLGILLALPDRGAMRDSVDASYHRRTLADRSFAAVREAMLGGEREGVFSLQLHGMEHYWPASLMRAAAVRPEVAAWLRDDESELCTESLPAELQSRWIDAAELPSSPLSDEEIGRAALEETLAFREILHRPPRVVVPPTFVWDARVEAAWRRTGLSAIVTPGWRFEGRGGDGRLGGRCGPILNGQSAGDGMIYLVRDDYFEPMMGHRAERAIEALRRKTRLGRPTLLETHRANFIREEETARRATRELDRLLGMALRDLPAVRFMSTEELARGFSSGSSDLLESTLCGRLRIFFRRVMAVGRLRKLAWLTGAVIPGWALYAGAGALTSQAR